MISNDGIQDGGAGSREHGAVVSFIGVALIIAALLIVFFAPAAFRVGWHGIFVGVIILLAAAGVVLMAVGSRLRRRRT